MVFLLKSVPSFLAVREGYDVLSFAGLRCEYTITYPVPTHAIAASQKPIRVRLCWRMTEMMEACVVPAQGYLSPRQGSRKG